MAATPPPACRKQMQRKTATAERASSPGHQPTAIHPIRQDAAQWREQYGGHYGNSQDRAKNFSRSRQFQHVHGQCEFQGVIADEGKHLPQQQQDKTAGK